METQVTSKNGYSEKLMNWKKSSVGLGCCYFGFVVTNICLFNNPLESSVYYGKVWRHIRQTKNASLEKVCWVQELAIRVQTLGKRDSGPGSDIPLWAPCLVLLELGKGSHNRAFGLLPWLNVPVQFNWLRIENFRLGTGLLAWVSNHMIGGTTWIKMP